MKEIFFLSGLPRAGNTLLSSIINENNNIKVSANTVLADAVYQLNIIKEYDIFNNFPDHKSLNNVINNIFNNYYKDWKVDYIIDRGPWGTPTNLFYLKKIIKKPKFILLHRPLLDCLASIINIEKPKNIEARCNILMQDDGTYGPGSGMIAKYLRSIKNIITSKEKYKVINYVDLVYYPNETIKTISNFLNIPIKYSKNFKQFSINGIKYNDKIYNVDYHTIRTKELKHSRTKAEYILPKSIINKYKNMDIE
jgi:hypothetical protein